MTRVLFVDDEPALLEGLRRSLYRAQKKWEMTFVTSAALAVAALRERAYDVVVSDMRMARADGAELLEIARDNSPQTARIVLSGYSEERQVTRLVPLAHQYLAKPCAPDRLQAAIEGCIKLQAMLHSPKVRALVGRVRTLPAIPRAYAELGEVMAREEATAAEVAAAAMRDSAIAAKILHVANSSFFRLARPVRRIEQAVVHLGFNAIRSLALSAEVFSRWPCISLEGFESDRIQAHAQAVATGAYVLAAGQPWADDAMLAGLLHDIGYWVLLQESPQEMVEVQRMARSEGISLPAAECRAFGASHAELGAYLLGLWGLPFPIIDAIAHHHAPELGAGEFNPLAALTISHALMDQQPLTARAPWSDGPVVVDASYLARVGAPFDWTEAQRRIQEVSSLEQSNG